jgi:hypothetical protein
MSEASRRTIWLSVFAVAMGFLEAAVVVYLRELYYPGGFRFPIVLIPDRVAMVELVREVTTILMLLAVSVLAGRSGHDRFFAFAYLFGVWDLVYYLALKLFLGWPESLLTWDVLFLIPVPWLSPVIYPMIVALLLVVGYASHTLLSRRRGGLRLGRWEWLVAVLGAIILVTSFCWEWRAVLEGVMPGPFPAPMFSAGLVLAAAPFALAAWRALQRRQN